MIASDAYLDTRVSLFAGLLWDARELDALVELADDALPAALAGRGLGELAADRGEGVHGFDPRSLERRVIARILDETRVLIRPLSGYARSFFAFWTARFEMSNVKTLLRSKMTGERAAAVLARLVPMGPFARLDHEDLAQAEDVGELLQRLEHGPYAGIVRPARRAFEQSGDPFSLDAALDRGYYEGLVARAKPLEDALGAPFLRLMSRLVDRVNLLWLMRYRFNYGLPPAQVYYLLVGSHYSLSGARLQHLAAQDSVGDVLDALPSAWRETLVGLRDIPSVFARLDQLAAGEAQRILGSRAPAVARAFAYLVLRERNLRAVRAVLRGRQLGLAGNEIRAALRHEGHA